VIVSEQRAKLQFTLQKIAIAWSFAMVVTSFNRVAISELGLSAAVISFVVGVYTLFGPLQPVIGRMCERWPLFRYRRTPYMLLGTVLGGMAFPFMPGVLVSMQAGNPLAYVGCLLLFCAFGICIAMQANVFLDLLNDVTTEDRRSKVVTTVWTAQAFAMAGWAWVFALIMPVYSFERMQFMYGLSPIVMLGITILGLVGLETRLTAEQVAEIRRNPPEPVRLLEPMKQSLAVLGASRHALGFFIFVVFSLLAMFLQDFLQEVWAADLFDQEAGEATVWQRIYNGMQAVGMAVAGIYTGISFKKRKAAREAAGEDASNEKMLPFETGKRLLALGVCLTVLGFLLLAWASYARNLGLFYVFYYFSAWSIGFTAFPSISFMADMTVKGQESKYLGLWSLAQVIGLFLSFTVSGSLYSALVESGVLRSNLAFAVIFVLQAVMIIFCWIAVRGVTLEGMQQEVGGSADDGPDLSVAS
jgi:BCD family chlorophyll transporter-like MFS transporter